MPVSTKPAWQEWIVISLLHVMIAITRRLPLAAARRLGRAVGTLLFQVNARMRRVAIRNLELAYPQWSVQRRRTVARQSVQSTAMLTAEMGHLWGRPWCDTASVLEVEGVESILQPLASGQGVIVLGPHLGNWELLGMHLATLGKLVALYEPLPLRKLDNLVHRGRQSTGGKLVPTTPRGLGELVRSVRGGGITGVLPDQVPRDINAGMNIPFFGVDCFTATLSLNLIRRSGAAAVMGTVLRTAGGFRAVYKPVEPEVYSDNNRDALAAINLGVEKLITRNEWQYQWQYKRFRCRPAGNVDHYNWETSPLLDEAERNR
jgi:Kdo2-lipid IVA lauroyltransferase/acyltransferase